MEKLIIQQNNYIYRVVTTTEGNSKLSVLNKSKTVTIHQIEAKILTKIGASVAPESWPKSTEATNTSVNSLHLEISRYCKNRAMHQR